MHPGPSLLEGRGENKGKDLYEKDILKRHKRFYLETFSCFVVISKLENLED